MLPENARNLAVRGALTGLCLEHVEGVSRRFQRTPLPPSMHTLAGVCERLKKSPYNPPYAEKKCPKPAKRLGAFFLLQRLQKVELSIFTEPVAPYPAGAPVKIPHMVFERSGSATRIIRVLARVR